MINGVVLRNELYMARRTIVAGTAGVVALMAVFGGLSGLIIESSIGDMIGQLIATLPPALLQAFNFDVSSLHSFEGWIASEPYTFFSLIVSMMAANWAAATVAREVDQGTAEAVVSLPIRRRALFLSTVASHVVMLTVMAAAAVVSALMAGALAVGVDYPGKVVALFSAGYLTALAFAGIGYAVSPFVDGERTATSIGAAVVLGTFVLDILSTLSDKLAWIARVSLFSLFDATTIVADGSLPLPSVGIALALFAGGVAVGVWRFQHKDIAS